MAGTKFIRNRIIIKLFLTTRVAITLIQCCGIRIMSAFHSDSARPTFRTTYPKLYKFLQTLRISTETANFYENREFPRTST